MMVIELRKAAKDKAFDLIDEIEDLGYKKKMALCELKDTLYECFESSEEDEREDDDYVDEMDFRTNRSYRRSNLRRNMKEHMYDDDMNMRGMRSYRSNMRMRRSNRAA